MANNTGIRELPNGNYEVRIVINRKDVKVNTIRRSDDKGNPFKTKKEARDFRDAFIQNARDNKGEAEPIKAKEVALREVYEKYMSEGAIGKAPSTVRKQKSMWENHIRQEFGDKYISQITLTDMENYLTKLYHNGDGRGKEQTYSYKYVEGFLKFFYLLFACAYKDNLISNENYTKMFIDKKTRLSMPEITQEDNDEMKNIKCFSTLEIQKMNVILQGSNFHVAFILGYMTGVRVSECFGLMWEDVDWNNHTIEVRRQLIYENGCWVLRPVKTLQSSRKIDMNSTLQDYLMNHYMAQLEAKSKLGNGYRNTERVIDRTAKTGEKIIVGGNFICRKENGELMTINSVKYWARVFKEYGIDFQYHSLRKTHATYMAALNTPVIELMNRLGHKKYDTTMKFYVNTNQLTKERLKQNAEMLSNNFIDGSINLSRERAEELKTNGFLLMSEYVPENKPIYSEKTIKDMGDTPTLEEILNRLSKGKDTE